PRPQPRSTLFPYTTLFRSGVEGAVGVVAGQGEVAFGADEGRAGGHRLAVGLHGDGAGLAGPAEEVGGDQAAGAERRVEGPGVQQDRKSTRLNSSHDQISYA